MKKTTQQELAEIESWNLQHGDRKQSVFTIKLEKAGLNPAQICAVLDAVDTTCRYCWDSDYPCYCMNDE